MRLHSHPASLLKIKKQYLLEQVTKMLETRKKRNFTETVELQITLRDYNPEKDVRFTGFIKLPHAPYPNIKVWEVVY